VEELPAVQVGDPFQEKKLLEACLEVIQTGAVVGMQDMGAAGIICSTAEMSAKGGVGMRIDLDKVPTRQKDMKTWELLLSESQERMLLVAEKGKEALIQEVFDKWDLPCACIGEVTEDSMLKFYMHGQLDAEIPAHELVLGGGAPQYERTYKEPDYFEKIKQFSPESISIPEDLQSVVKSLLSLPSIASKKFVFQQYDSMVGTANVSTNAPSDASIVHIKETQKGLAITVDCNSRYVYADPYKGAQIAVSEAARNIVCSGGKPLGVTNCLNFGNPYDPEVYYQFVHAIKGMGDACRKFDTPVTGGNVSFYNQHPEGAVYPTPTIGMVGLLENIHVFMTLDFKTPGDLIFLIGQSRNDIGSSEYLHKLKGVEFSPAPFFDLDHEFQLQERVALLISEKAVESVHDLSEGGLITALFESAFNRSLGFEVAQQQKDIRRDAYWFGESQSRVLVTIKSANADLFKKIMQDFPCEQIGVVSAGVITVDQENWGSVESWNKLYDEAIGSIMQQEAGV